MKCCSAVICNEPTSIHRRSITLGKRVAAPPVGRAEAWPYRKEALRLDGHRGVAAVSRIGSGRLLLGISAAAAARDGAGRRIAESNRQSAGGECYAGDQVGFHR